MAAMASEMDNVGDISDMGLQIKKGLYSDHIFPTMSILDPTYTYTLPKRQTVASTADIMSHTFKIILPMLMVFIYKLDLRKVY